jgi:hypothetical protein
VAMAGAEEAKLFSHGLTAPTRRHADRNDNDDKVRPREEANRRAHYLQRLYRYLWNSTPSHHGNERRLSLRATRIAGADCVLSIIHNISTKAHNLDGHDRNSTAARSRLDRMGEL